MEILEKASDKESGSAGDPRVAGVYPSRVHRATDGWPINGAFRLEKPTKTIPPPALVSRTGLVCAALPDAGALAFP